MTIKKRVPMPCVRFAALIFRFFSPIFRVSRSPGGRCAVRSVYTD
jgi:hypothetical protein